MSKQAKCAHCSAENGARDSMDDGRAVRCPACGELVCPSCRAMSGPATCGSFADGDENAEEIDYDENRNHRRARLAAWRRAGSPFVAGDQYPLAKIA